MTLLQFVKHNQGGAKTMPGRKIHTCDMWWSLWPLHWTSNTQSNHEECKPGRTSLVLEVWSCWLPGLDSLPSAEVPTKPCSMSILIILLTVDSVNEEHSNHSWRSLFTQNCKLCWFIWLMRSDEPVHNCAHHWLWSLESSGMWCHAVW